MPVVREHPHAALRKHDVVIQLIGQLLVELDRKFVKGSRFREEIIRADDRRVAAGVAAADPAALAERDVGETMVPRKIISGREAMPATTDNDRVLISPIGRAFVRVRGCLYEMLAVVSVAIKTKNIKTTTH